MSYTKTGVTAMKGNLTLIDTDILIFILRMDENAIKQSREYQLKNGRLKISELTYYECLRGYKSSNATKKIQLFMELINNIEIFPLDKAIYDKASEIFAKLRELGFPTGEFDLLIASTALINNLKLTTNNTKDYLKIQEYFGLELDNWVK